MTLTENNTPELRQGECPKCAEHPLCEFRDIRTEGAPREILCPKCGQWNPFVESNYTGPEIKNV